MLCLFLIYTNYIPIPTQCPIFIIFAYINKTSSRMIYKGELRKMPTVLKDDGTVEYEMTLFDTETQSVQTIAMKEVIGKEIKVIFGGNIYCIGCGRKTRKSFAQGFCFPCFKNSPLNSECIIRPELCKAHIGEGRDPEWEEAHHNKPHYVYLAATDKVKVGVTRDTQIPTRWIDQGASSAIILANTPNRYLAGVIEVALKDTFDDKTNWQAMLMNNIDNSIDLEQTKHELGMVLPDDIGQYICDDDEVTYIAYPVLEFPKKIKSINLDKELSFSGKLMGIKGQYLILDENRVINIRKYEGYQVEIEI